MTVYTILVCMHILIRGVSEDYDCEIERSAFSITLPNMHTCTREQHQQSSVQNLNLTQLLSKHEIDFSFLPLIV